MQRICTPLGSGLLRFRKRTVAVIAAAAVAVVTSTAVMADTVTVKGEITTAEDLNPDYRGRPSPVSLILFQLKSADAFNNADFFSLFDPASEILAGDLIDRSQRMLQPGQSFEIEEEFDEDARFVGFVAAYQDIEQAQWRGLIELPEKGFLKSVFRRKKLLIELQALAVQVAMD